jgi:UDP-2,4-diacetamido-2,4,6-trideoxy-beta-L-altropyranose hydrolase
MRCLTLADRLRAGGAEVCFLCRESEGSFIPFIRNRGYAVTALSGKRRLVAVAADEPVHPHECWLGASWNEDVEQTIAALSVEREAGLANRGSLWIFMAA